MKTFKSKFIIPIVLVIVLLLIPHVYAKTSIEIKPNAGKVYTNKTISDFFDESKAMKDTGEVLEGATVDVHMATNIDWAIVSFFSGSAYGGWGEITIDGEGYSSTNANITGVIDLGKTHTYTAGIISNYEEIVDTSATDEPYDYGKRIIENVGNNSHVDIFTKSEEWKKSAYVNSNYVSQSQWYPFSIRYGLAGIAAGNVNPYANGAYAYPTGGASPKVTFRPVFWN